MNLNKNNFLLFFMLVIPIITIAQTHTLDSIKTEQLEKIVISATRTKRQLSSIPLPTTIIDQIELKKGNYNRIGEVLEEQSGITIVSDFGGVDGVQMQGLDAQYTLVLIDGVPLIGRTSGTLDINRITTSNIEQIEIVKGASSSLYGSDALAGVINIITSKPKKGHQGAISYRHATFNTYDIRGDYSVTKNKTSLQLSLNTYGSDGYNLDNSTAIKTVEAFNNQTLNTKILHQLNDKLNIHISTKYYQQSQENNPESSVLGNSNIKEWAMHSKLAFRGSKKIRTFLEFYSTRYKTSEQIKNEDAINYYNHLLNRVESRTIVKTGTKSNIVTGVGINYETLDRTYFDKQPYFRSPYVYFQYDFYPHKNTNVIIGARYDSHNKYQSQLSPKIAIHQKISSKINIKASFGYGYKAPDFRQLYFDFTNSSVGYTVVGFNVANDVLNRLYQNGEINQPVFLGHTNELKPESSINLNVGTRIKFNSKAIFELNLFRNNIKNLIDTYALPIAKNNGQNIFTYKNISQVYTQGLEANMQWQLSSTLKLKAGYQLLYAKSEEAKNRIAKGEVFVSPKEVTASDFRLKLKEYVGLFNRSKHMANFKMYYNIPKWKTHANIRVIYRSKFGMFSTNGNEYLDKYDDFIKGFTLINVAVNKKINKNYELSVGSENLLNYTDNNDLTNLPGRIIYTKLNIKL